TNYYIAQNHLKALIYFHLAQLDSLRDIHDFMESDSDLNELINPVSLGSLSNYNNNINFEVYIPLLNQIIATAMNQLSIDHKIKEFGSVKIIDSSTVSMALSYFKWAEFRKTKAGIKLHTKYDLGKGVPELVIVSNAKVHDKKKMEELMTEKNCIYVVDKAYVDYKKFDKFTDDGKYFITRLKDNAVTEEVETLKITYSQMELLDEDTTIVYDKVVYLGNEYINKTKKKYRIIKIIDAKGKELIFVTNVFHLSSEEIAWLYKKRWEIELFFKWIKQHLKIKKFIGYSLNAVMNQIITAIIAFIMIKMVQKIAKSSLGLLKIKRLIKHSITKHVDNRTFNWAIWLGS
ncbi:IS4 family transposase, partial [Paramaledivibacter caminithermalis]